MIQKPKYWEIIPNSWEEAKLIGRSEMLLNHVFRGQGNSKWPLQTSAERLTERYQGYLVSSFSYEKFIIDRFKAGAHQYIQSLPNDDELLEWLTLIQHFGGPTRLLDFTESFYTATFFAVENTNEDACVWGIHEVFIENPFPEIGKAFETHTYFPERKKAIAKYAESFIESWKPKDAVLIVRPTRMNERSAIQKGVFAFPCNSSLPFENNLCTTYDFPFKKLESSNAEIISSKIFIEKFANSISYYDTPSVIKIVLRKEWHKDILNDLYNMNIDAASLFPGLDGFARSLNFIIQSKEYTSFEEGGRR